MDVDDLSDEDCTIVSGLPDETKLNLLNRLDNLESIEDDFVPFAREFDRFAASEGQAAACTQSVADLQFTLQVSDQSSGVAMVRLMKDDDLVALMEDLAQADGLSLESWCPGGFDKLEKLGKKFRLAPPFAWKPFDTHSFTDIQSKIPEPAKIKEKKPRSQASVKATATVTRLKEIENVTSDLQNHLSTTLDVILQITSPPNPSDVSFFQLVINPKSFPNTIYNIYLTSFLMNERLLGLAVKADHELFITPIHRNISLKPRDRNVTDPVQSIMSLNAREWNELVRSLRVTKALLPEFCPKESRYMVNSESCDELSQGVQFLDP